MVCCFIGHREINITEELSKKIVETIEYLIVIKGVTTFLFGSRSQFNNLCHNIVTDLKNKYTHIERISYTCKSENCTIESERINDEIRLSKLLNKEVHLLGVELEKEFQHKYTAGRASYVERNRSMIDDSDICIFYYNPEYQLELRKYSKNSIGYYQPSSGTKLAYQYAIQKKKEIINVFY